MVYSSVHVDEIRNSAHPDSFIEVLETIPAYFWEDNSQQIELVTLNPNRARELITAPEDATSRAKRHLEKLLRIIQYSIGWLKDFDESALSNELILAISGFWEEIRNELKAEALFESIDPAFLYSILDTVENEMIQSTKQIPFGTIRKEHESSLMGLSKILPLNFAQLDDIPAHDVIEYIFSKMSTPDFSELPPLFPRGFFANNAPEKSEKLISLCFMMFLFGVVRDRRVRKRENERRIQHFLGQFRDCQHIANASKCALFFTFDAGASRLAQAVYSYASVPTLVRQFSLR